MVPVGRGQTLGKNLLCTSNNTRSPRPFFEGLLRTHNLQSCNLHKRALPHQVGQTSTPFSLLGKSLGRTVNHVSSLPSLSFLRKQITLLFLSFFSPIASQSQLLATYFYHATSNQPVRLITAGRQPCIEWIVLLLEQTEHLKPQKYLLKTVEKRGFKLLF